MCVFLIPPSPASTCNYLILDDIEKHVKKGSEPLSGGNFFLKVMDQVFEQERIQRAVKKDEPGEEIRAVPIALRREDLFNTISCTRNLPESPISGMPFSDS
jgi:hypothetical protein